ncbi:phosphatase PAP2 family protein [Gelidibacter salicanalis]|uniref:Phosphatase PAP2 family protein n=1 Tax=Gelidibacter salicanalis TaxID=291193 RepID=A0A934KTR2_9FLAO|nr:phosphatase PAP2 family protein [Gelidibacter salicanalis]MBJ7879280.1 phosphatase PAP2 family protein [Gelidibacter salicanalis]
MIDQILQLDTEVFIFLNSLGTPTWDPFWLAYTSKFNWIPFYAILLYLISRQMKIKAIIITMVLVALMILVTDQVTNLFKDGFHRLRPCHLAELIDGMRLVKANCGGQYGFFSGHASNTMAAAFFIGLTLKKRFKYMLYFLIVWALLMGYSRIYIGVHYPLDVLLGTIFGVITGTLFYKLNGFLIDKFNANTPKKTIA